MSAGKQYLPFEGFGITSADRVLDAKLARCDAASWDAGPLSLHIGSILFQEGVLLPQELAFESDRYTVGWRAVRTIDGFAVDRMIRAAGWNLFMIGSAIRTIALGTSARTVRYATVRSLGRVHARGFNSAELKAVTQHHFLGVPYTAVTIQPRHVQQECVIQSATLRMQTQSDVEWAER